MGLIWLKHYGGALGLPPKFSIMDEDDAQGLVHLLMSKLSFSRRKGFPKKQHILALFSRAVNTLRSIADTVSSDFPWLETHTPQLVVLFRAYTETKWRQHRVDYDDLLFLVYKLLCLHEPTPVSYTHLDVYKRQALHTSSPKGFPPIKSFSLRLHAKPQKK